MPATAPVPGDALEFGGAAHGPSASQGILLICGRRGLACCCLPPQQHSLSKLTSAWAFVSSVQAMDCELALVTA